MLFRSERWRFKKTEQWRRRRGRKRGLKEREMTKREKEMTEREREMTERERER